MAMRVSQSGDSWLPLLDVYQISGDIKYAIFYYFPLVRETSLAMKNIGFFTPVKKPLVVNPNLGHWHCLFNVVENTGLTNNQTVLYIRMQHFKYLYNMFTNHTLLRNWTITLGPFRIWGVNRPYFWTIIHRATVGNIVLQTNQNISIWNSGCTNYI